MALADHVRITVRRVRSIAGEAGFGTMAALDAHRLWEDRYRSFGSLQELVDAGVHTTDTLYRLAASYFAQNPAPETLGVGRRDVGDTVYAEVDTVGSERTYDLTIGGLLLRVTSAPAATEELIAGKLVTEVNGGYEIFTVTAGAGGAVIGVGRRVGEFEAGETLRVAGFVLS